MIIGLLGLLGAVFRTALLTVGNALGIAFFRAANDGVANTGKVFHTTAADNDDRVFLKVVAFAGNVGGNFITVRQANTGDFPKCRVRLLGSRCGNTGTDAATVWAGLECRHFIFFLSCDTTFADELIDCWHQ